LFLAGERPTGSRDPFGLRRQSHGVLRILADAEALTGVRVRTPLEQLLRRAAAGFGALADRLDATWPDLAAFLAERLQYIAEARGADRRHIRAVIPGTDAALGTPVSDLLQNLAALPEFARSESFRQLATAFKRVRNIGREYASDTFTTDESTGPPLDGLLVESAERALFEELETRRPLIARAVETGAGYREAYVEASRFEPLVARFFEEVFVMSDDLALRQARLRLLKRLETVILQLGDISELVATE
jgi:glycyl-tRNA synthetase beta chain